MREQRKRRKSIDGQVWLCGRASVFVCICDRVSMCKASVNGQLDFTVCMENSSSPLLFVLLLSLLNRSTPAHQHTPHHVNISMPKIERFQAKLMAIKADTASKQTVGVARSEQRTADEWKKSHNNSNHSNAHTNTRTVFRIIYRY